MRPTFVVSLDTELIWGSFDHTSDAEFAAKYPDLRGTIRGILQLFDQFEISATWAVVGHLFLKECSRGADGRAHPELQRPRHAWFKDDWFSRDPCSDREKDPLWYGDDVIDAILDAKTKQELGSHSFSHAVFGDEGCTAEVAASELRASIAQANKRGVKLTSFVFPRNVEGHHALLKEHGFTAYRGADPNWYEPLPGLAHRAAHFLDQAAALAPPVSLPVETLPGLWNIPGSMLLLHRSGVRRYIPFEQRIAKAKAGLRRAIDESKVFHLWFHPFNLAHDRDGMLETLKAILAEAATLRSADLLDIRTMGDLARRC